MKYKIAHAITGTLVLKLQIFVAGILKQIRPIWIGDLGTKLKNSKIIMFGALHSPTFPGNFV